MQHRKFGANSRQQIQKNSDNQRDYRSFQLDYQDSNLDKQNQNLLCYHYTIVQT